MSTSQSGILKRNLESAWLSIRRYSAHIPDPVNFQDFEIQVSNDQASMQEVRPLLDRFSAPRSQGVCRELVLPDPRTRLLLESSSLAVDEMVGGCGITIPLCVREISSDSAT